ncbi:alpha-tocopherol transfer protein-like [Saccoglossus kowalevskii]|uniref:Alpha-tocopherol transfer protein-like n=1 Tax=Saccoglossus kowalevskii TaxID=10224 RepID=A0ABM0MCP4_SACKO|nr:PREDICTED: alpha-tocopherol transfer protein-like [Saccoglossus kowalevskii]
MSGFTRSKSYVCNLSNELQEKARRELNEKSETRHEFIKALREKTKTREDIKFRDDDKFLLRFLRARKFNLDKAFKNLVRYYEIQIDYPEVFSDLRPSSLKHVYDQHLSCVTPVKDTNGAIVGINALGKWDPDRCSYVDTVKAAVISSEYLLEDERIQINGVVTILDFADLATKHSAYIMPSNAKMMMTILQSILPLRFKAMHYVNTPPLFETGYKIYQAFMSAKMRKRTHLHSDELGSLHEYVPSACLPCDYGGVLPELSTISRENSEKLFSWEQSYIDKNAGYGLPKMSEALGGDSTSMIDPSGGLVGSFKKLDV